MSVAADPKPGPAGHSRAEQLRHHMSTAPAAGLLVAAVLMFVAGFLPAAFNWDVHMRYWPPLHAEWDPRLGTGTVPSIVLGALGVCFAARLARAASWRRLLLGVYAVGVAWMVSLAAVDGLDGIGVILDTDYEYLQPARGVDSWGEVSTLLREYVDRIPYAHPDNWPVHLAGHPPGAVLFFVLLAAVGLGSGLAAGWTVIALAATIPVAVLITLRTMGAEDEARLAAPFLVLGPVAIWLAVSGDAVFAVFGAWGLCCLAIAATRTSPLATAGWGVLAGLLLGYGVMMSYGLPLLGLIAVSILLVARNVRPLPWAVVTSVAVVLTFWAGGFAWWEALPVVRERQYDGVAENRPQAYYLWGNLAALSYSAGPIMFAGVATALGRRWSSWREVVRGQDSTRVVVLLTSAAVAMVLVADVSGMSKGEVERIWLPFVPWLLVGTALLPRWWRTVGLTVQVVLAIVVQHALRTGW